MSEWSEVAESAKVLMENYFDLLNALTQTHKLPSDNDWWRTRDWLIDYEKTAKARRIKSTK